MFAGYSNQERTVQEKGVHREVRITATRRYIECVAVNYCCGNGKAFADRQRIRIGGRKATRVCRKTTKVRRRKKEGGGREKKNVDNWKRKKKKNVDNWKRKKKKSVDC